MLGVNFEEVKNQLRAEENRFIEERPMSRGLYDRGLKCFLYGAPMHWMQQWPGRFPIYVSKAQGAQLTDVDNHTYVDFALGDTGAMFGHANPVINEAINEQSQLGTTMMLTTEDSIWVGEELTRRFGLPYWQVTTSATDANRFVIRLCRMITGREKVIVFNWNYHGSVDETQVELDKQQQMIPRTGVHPNAMKHEQTTRLAEFNDVEGLKKALSDGDVACVLTEPIMTNIGMVPAESGYHEALRELTRKHNVPLIIDETHTISSGPGGYTRAYSLSPDYFVLGKSIAGGIPVAVWGTTKEMAEKIWNVLPHFRTGEDINHFGFGGTLAGNALQMAAMRKTLSEVMTEENYHHMITMAERFETGVWQVIKEFGLSWHVTRIGARVEYLFMPNPPRNGGEAHLGRHGLLEAFIHLYMLNRGILLTPFHNMALMCPFTKSEDVDKHNRLLNECVTMIT
jgi:glutamate-1-semialdehyde 2,1-aminomutase